MEKINILVLGKDGMLGHKLFQQFEKDPGINTYGTSRKNTNRNTFFFDPVVNFFEIRDITKQYNITTIVNCIGILNHEANHDNLFNINSVFPKRLEKLFINSKIKLVHLSTDCVFNGRIGNYSENDVPDADDLYGKSKFLGELNNSKDLTIRCSIIGPELESSHNTGLLNWFLKQSEKKFIKGFSNVYWSGTSTIKLSQIIKYAIKNNITGLSHVSVPKKINKYDLLTLFSKYSNIEIKIELTEEPRYDKSLVSIDSRLSIKEDYEQIIKEMFEDIEKNKRLYRG